VPAVLLHGVEDRLRLETHGFQGRSCYVASLGVLRDAEHGALAVVDPVRREEATESRDKDQPAVVVDRLGELGDFVRGEREAHVAHQEVDARAGDGDASLQGVCSVSFKVVCDGCQKPVFGEDWFLAHVVEQETPGAVPAL